jgi:hypothetical protein
MALSIDKDETDKFYLKHFLKWWTNYKEKCPTVLWCHQLCNSGPTKYIKYQRTHLENVYFSGVHFPHLLIVSFIGQTTDMLTRLILTRTEQPVHLSTFRTSKRCDREVGILPYIHNIRDPNLNLVTRCSEWGFLSISRQRLGVVL